MEEDTGKGIHDLDITNTLMDYNRAGTALVEIVTEPDFSSGEEAYVFLSEIRKLVRYLDVCDGNMEEGSLRCDANVSIRPIGSTSLGTKVEVKNMNSISNVKKAIEYEFARQSKWVNSGQELVSETRSFDAIQGTTFSMRSKEMVNDYRFFPEPDLPPLIVAEQWIKEIKALMPALPQELITRFTEEYQLGNYDAEILTESKEVADYFIAVCENTTNYKAAANWVMGPIKGWVNSQATTIHTFPLKPLRIAQIISAIDNGLLSFSVAEQKLFPALLEHINEDVESIINKLNLKQTDDEDTLRGLVQEVISEHPDKVIEYQAGKTGLIGMFMGQIMKKSGGKADPKKTKSLLIEYLK